jgi:predicted protein tyrosine phosphatase
VDSLLEEEAAQLELDSERTAAESNRIRFISFPIPGRGAPASMRDALRLLREIAKALEQGKKVAIHCRQGVGRSGMSAAGVVGSGIEAGRAMDAVGAARGAPIPETSAQRRRIQQLPAKILALTSRRVEQRHRAGDRLHPHARDREPAAPHPASSQPSASHSSSSASVEDSPCAGGAVR